MAIAQENDAWMNCPDSNVKDGRRWGFASKDGVFRNGFREQRIGDKVIKHDARKAQ